MLNNGTRDFLKNPRLRDWHVFFQKINKTRDTSTSALFHWKSAAFVISRNTDIDKIKEIDNF